MKVLLLNPPSEVQCARALHRASIGKLSYIWPPVDLIYMGGLLEESGFDFEFHDFQIETEKSFDTMLNDKQFDVVISTYSSFIEKADMRELSKIKKILPHSKVLVMASHIDRMDESHIRSLLLSHKFIDALVYDFAINEVDRFLDGERKKNLKNIFFLHGEDIYGKSVPLPSEVELPVPNHNKFRSGHYFHYDGQNGDLATVMGSFGCKMPCKFCWGPDIYPRVSMRNPRNLADEFELIAKQGFKEVYFHDYTFAYKKQVGKEFCREIIKRNINLRWYCSARIDLVDEDLIALMGNAGCKCIEFGIESGNYDVRKIYGKNFTDEEIRYKVGLCKAAGINVSVFIILGLFEEGIPEMKISVKFVESLPIDYAAYNILWAEPNTRLMDQIGDGVKNCDEKDTLNFLNFDHPFVTHKEIVELKNKFNRSFYLRVRIIIKHLLRLTTMNRLKITFRSVKKLFF